MTKALDPTVLSQEQELRARVTNQPQEALGVGAACLSAAWRLVVPVLLLQPLVLELPQLERHLGPSG